jgi:hypothetical protein
MRKIAIVTNAAVHCGIHQYGQAVYRVLSGSNKYKYEFVTTPHEYVNPFLPSEKIEWTAWLNTIDCDAILYNHCPSTMGWLDDEIVGAVNKPQWLITGHDELKTLKNIQHYFVTNPLFENTNTHSALLRPLLLDQTLDHAPPSDVIKVGTFGLVYNSKNLPLLVKYVNDSFPPDQLIELNIHATVGQYIIDGHHHLNRAVMTCRAFANPNVTVNITTDFIESLDEVVVKLHNNDINVFLYSDEPNRFAVSSALDLALSARKPVAISRSSMFAHARHVEDIVVDLDELQHYTGKQFNWLPDILKLGMAPLEQFYVDWAPDKFCKVIEEKIDEFC